MTESPTTAGRPRDPDVDHRALQAALDLYGTGGCAAVTFTSVAASAGVGKGALYRRWDDPEDLLVEALTSIEMPTLDLDGDPVEALAAYANALLTVLRSQPGRALLRLTTEFHDDSARLRSFVSLAARQMIDQAEELARRAVRRGAAHPVVPAGMIMEIISGSVLSAMMREIHLADGDGRGLDTALREHGHELACLVWHGRVDTDR